MSCHYLVEGRTSPAVTAEELVELRRTGSINDESLVWESGMSDWVPFQTWQGQRERAAAMPPVPQRRAEPERQPEPEPVAAAQPRMVRCKACGQTWAEALTDGVTCKSCLAKGVQAQKEKDNVANAEFRVKSDNRYYYLLFGVSLLAALTWIFLIRGSGRRFLFRSAEREMAAMGRAAEVGAPAEGFTPAVATASAIPAPRDLAPGKWRSKDFDKWPRLVFYNRAEFPRTEFGYPASSVFLVRVSPALTVGVTAGTPFRGNDALQSATFPGQPPADFAPFSKLWKPPGWKVAQVNKELATWTGNLGSQELLRFTAVNPKGGDDMAAQVLDVTAPKEWPCTPLEPRRTPLLKGDELAIVYVDRSNTGHRQYLAQARTLGGTDQFAPLELVAPTERFEGMLGGVALDKDGRFAGTVVAVVGDLQDGKVTRVLIECAMRTAAKAEWPVAK